jgi:hypothetical protein
MAGRRVCVGRVDRCREHRCTVSLQAPLNSLQRRNSIVEPCEVALDGFDDALLLPPWSNGHRHRQKRFGVDTIARHSVIHGSHEVGYSLRPSHEMDEEIRINYLRLQPEPHQVVVEESAFKATLDEPSSTDRCHTREQKVAVP